MEDTTDHFLEDTDDDWHYPRRAEVFPPDAVRLGQRRAGPVLECRLETGNRRSTLALQAGREPLAWVRVEGRTTTRWRSCIPAVDEILKPIAILRHELEKEWDSFAGPERADGADGTSAGFPSRARCYHSLRLVDSWLKAFDSAGLEFLHANGFREGRWQLLSLWMRAPHYHQCMSGHPALAWLFACAWHARNAPWTGGNARCAPPPSSETLRPYVILRWLGIPHPDDALRLLRRWPCRDLQVGRWHGLLRALRSPATWKLLHASTGTWDRESLQALAGGAP